MRSSPIPAWSRCRPSRAGRRGRVGAALAFARRPAPPPGGAAPAPACADHEPRPRPPPYGVRRRSAGAAGPRAGRCGGGVAVHCAAQHHRRRSLGRAPPLRARCGRRSGRRRGCAAVRGGFAGYRVVRHLTADVGGEHLTTQPVSRGGPAAKRRSADAAALDHIVTLRRGIARGPIEAARAGTGLTRRIVAVAPACTVTVALCTGPHVLTVVPLHLALTLQRSGSLVGFSPPLTLDTPSASMPPGRVAAATTPHTGGRTASTIAPPPPARHRRPGRAALSPQSAGPPGRSCGVDQGR